MSLIQQSIEIQVATEKVFSFLTDPNKIPLVLPSLISNNNVPTLPLQVGSSFQYVYQLYGVELTGNWVVTVYEPNTRYEAKTDGDAVSEWKYKLESSGDTTKVSIEVQYETPSSVLEAAKLSVIEKINDSEISAFLKNLKTALEL